MTVVDAQPDDSGQAYFDFIAGELRDEFIRLDSLNDRANRALSASGSILASFTALTGLAIGADLQLRGASMAILAIAFAMLAGSNMFAVLGSRLTAYEVASIDSLKKMVANEHWEAPVAQSLNALAQQRIETIESLRDGNNKKADQLKKAAWLQLTALATLASLLLLELGLRAT